MSEDDLDEIDDHELFDISDISFDFQRIKGNCKVYIILKSETPINLMRFYLALKQYIFTLESEIGVMAEENLEEQ